MRRLEHIELETWQLGTWDLARLAWRNQRQRICTCWLSGFWCPNRNGLEGMRIGCLWGIVWNSFDWRWKRHQEESWTKHFFSSSLVGRWTCIQSHWSSLSLQHDSGKSMKGRQIPSVVSVWAEQYERFLMFSKATPSEMSHFATCQEILRLAKAWSWDMKPLFTAFKSSNAAMLSFSIYRFLSKPRLCHPDVAGPEGEDFYNFRCLADPCHFVCMGLVVQ